MSSPQSMSTSSETAVMRRPVSVPGLGALAFLAGVVLWAYWPALTDMADRWANDSKYSHGYLVPAFAVFLLWFRRDLLPADWFRPTVWGLAFVALGAAVHLFGARYYYAFLDAYALLPTLAGLCLLLAGWKGLRWAWPAIAFLVFMMPLPHRVENSFAFPLQRVATVASTYVLQTVGFPALARGNIISVEGIPDIGVVEACNGLAMLITFCALSTAVAIVIDKSWIEKLVVLLSAIPIALIANIARIVATVALHKFAGEQIAQNFFHDYAGWTMMPLALGILWVELKLLSWLIIEETPEQPIAVDLLRRNPARGSRPELSARSAESPKNGRGKAAKKPEIPLPAEATGPAAK